MFLYSPRKWALKRKRLDSAFPINNFLINTVNYTGQQLQAEIISHQCPRRHLLKEHLVETAHVSVRYVTTLDALQVSPNTCDSIDSSFRFC